MGMQWCGLITFTLDVPLSNGCKQQGREAAHSFMKRFQHPGLAVHQMFHAFNICVLDVCSYHSIASAKKTR
jgi:hypothetical protein